jgi:gamma-glutamylputrescine oxidase
MADQARFGSTWYSAVKPLPPPRSTLNYDLDVDACVIGGGLAGLTVARELVRRQWSVAVIEAERVGWKASGRSSGFVVPGFPSRIDKIVERIGLEAAKDLWALSEGGVQYVRDTIASFGRDGIVAGDGWLDVARTPKTDAARGRVALLAGEFGVDVESWPVGRVRDALKTNHYFHAVHFPQAFHIDPLAYVLRLAEAAEREGAHIFENTPATAIDAAGLRKRVATPRARLRANHIVLAANLFQGSVAERLSETLLPVTAYTGVSRPLGRRLEGAVAYSGAISDSHLGGNHYRVVAGDRLLWTAGAGVKPRRPTWMQWRLERAIRALYPQLGAVEFESFWSGEMGFAIHGMPQIGEVQPDVWLASGFGGRGIATSAMAGDLIARAMVEGDDRWRLFLPYELVWAGGRLGRAVAGSTLGLLQGREAIAALVARWQEDRRHRRLAGAARGPNTLPAYRNVDPAHPDGMPPSALPPAASIGEVEPAANLPPPASVADIEPVALLAPPQAVGSTAVEAPVAAGAVPSDVLDPGAASPQSDAAAPVESRSATADAPTE